jgi:hypothetical protein
MSVKKLGPSFLERMEQDELTRSYIDKLVKNQITLQDINSITK